MNSERFEDLFDVVWDGRTELLPPRESKGYAWSTVDGPGTPDRQKPRPKPTGPGSGGNHNPLGLGGPTRKILGIGAKRRERITARDREFADLVRRFAPTRCACGCGGHLDQKSVSLPQARRGEWSRYRQGHGGRDMARRHAPGPGSLEWNGPIIK